jgi:uncharacterized protein YbaR (Trm112 family)
MDTRLIELLVCPVCKGPLQRPAPGHHLICHADRLGFPIRDGIPIMLENEAVALDENDQPLPPAPATDAGEAATATGA